MMTDDEYEKVMFLAGVQQSVTVTWAERLWFDDPDSDVIREIRYTWDGAEYPYHNDLPSRVAEAMMYVLMACPEARVTAEFVPHATEKRMTVNFTTCRDDDGIRLVPHRSSKIGDVAFAAHWMPLIGLVEVEWPHA